MRAGLVSAVLLAMIFTAWHSPSSALATRASAQCLPHYQDPATKFLPYGGIGWNIDLVSTGKCFALRIRLGGGDADYRTSTAVLRVEYSRFKRQALAYLRRTALLGHYLISYQCLVRCAVRTGIPVP